MTEEIKFRALDNAAGLNEASAHGNCSLNFQIEYVIKVKMMISVREQRFALFSGELFN